MKKAINIKEIIDIFKNYEHLYSVHDEIKIKLFSSKKQGDYFLITIPNDPEDENFGLNNSPFRPIFSVRTKKYIKIKIYPELIDFLKFRHIDYYDDKIPFPYPKSMEEEINSFEDPIYLFVLRKGIRRWSFNPRNIENCYIFEYSDTMPMYRCRNILFDYLKEQLLKNICSTKIIQKDLKITSSSIDINSDDIKKIIELIKNYQFDLGRIALFNHLIINKDYGFYKNNVITLRLNNEIIVVNNSDNYHNITAVAYNYAIENIEIEPSTARLITHPKIFEE